MIRIAGLRKRYGSFFAVQSLDLHVRRGEVFGFLGPNGAGKTTTMRMLVGLIQPTEGLIEIGGIDVVRDPIRARRLIGYIPDRPYLYEKLTAREFLMFLSGLWDIPPIARRDRADEMLALFGLSEWADELIESFSHGMKQRLTMAGALLHRPELLVVDEPMVGLDPRGAALVKGLFRQMAQEGATVFLSTHTLEVAEELCDRIAILHRGEITALGTLNELSRDHGEGSGSRLEPLFLRLTGGLDPMVGQSAAGR